MTQARGNREQGTGRTGTGIYRRVLAVSLSALSVLGLAGCRQDMHNQPKFYPQRGTTLYSDGRSARPQAVNTVARGQLDDTSYFMTGFSGGKEGDGMPMPVTLEMMQRGQERYNIYCTACHSRVGNGGGIVVQRGYRPAGNFHIDRLRQAPLGHFYNVIANGYGAMPEYGTMLAVEDRWAVVAYIRALQLSQNATMGDAGGNKIERLGDVAERDGLPRNFASEWTLPATAVYGTPDKNAGIPYDTGNGYYNGGISGGGESQNTPRGNSTNSQTPEPHRTESRIVGKPRNHERPALSSSSQQQGAAATDQERENAWHTDTNCRQTWEGTTSDALTRSTWNTGHGFCRKI